MRADIPTRLAAHRFEFRQTGGNCTAYIRTDEAQRPTGTGPEIEETITLAGTAEAPTRLNDLCDVTTRNLIPGEDDPTGRYGVTATLRTILAALDDPRDEYELLELRLTNWYAARPMEN